MAGNLLFTVLSDGETFGGADDSAIYLGPRAEKLTDDQHDALQNGELPLSVLDTWPCIEIKLKANGDLVAVLHGLPVETDGREIRLASREQLALLA